MDAVVADLEVGQAGACLLPGFQVHQVLTGVLAERLEFVQLGVVAGLDHPTVADYRRRVVDDGARQQVGQFRIGTDAACQFLQVGHIQLGHRALQLRQGGEGVTQAGEIARTGVAQADAGEDALDVADFLQLRLQAFEAVAIQQAVDGVLAGLEYGAVTQRAVQPAAEQAAAHGGLAAVDHRLQGVVAPTGQVHVQFQVAAAGGVEDDGVVDALVAQAAQVGQGGALGFLGVGQEAAGGADGQRQGFAAEALKILHAELLAEALLR
ncbi:hypothetical protein D9M71_409260 [compost metagenome]